MNQPQSASKPWVFTSNVDLCLSTADNSKYSLLPFDVQKKIMNVGSQAFSGQQLLLDLTNAALMTISTISGITLLGCPIFMHDAPLSTLNLTSFNFAVKPYLVSTG